MIGVGAGIACTCVNFGGEFDLSTDYIRTYNYFIFLLDKHHLHYIMGVIIKHNTDGLGTGFDGYTRHISHCACKLKKPIRLKPRLQAPGLFS